MRKKGVGCFLIICIMLFSFSFQAFAQQAPSVVAETAVLTELETGRILFEKDKDKRIYPASMTKLLTALIALVYFSPDDLITAGDEVNEIPYDSSRAGHLRGETLTVENLIRGLILPSGNDSGNVIAAAVAKKVTGDNSLPFSECESTFADLMNQKAEELGATNSHFTNAHGYHDENHYSTAADIAKISAAALENTVIREIVQEERFAGNGAGEELADDETLITQNYIWTSHNMLLMEGEYYYEYAIGLKTGFMDESGDCVAAAAQKDGVTLIAVICNSEDPGRWQDAVALFEFGFQNYSMTTIQQSNETVGTVSLSGHNRLQGDTLDVVIKEDISYYMTPDEAAQVEKSITYRDDLIAPPEDETDTTIRLNAPLEKDAQVGTITYTLNGQVIGQTNVYAANGVEESTIWTTVQYFIRTTLPGFFNWKGLVILAVVIIILVLITVWRKHRRKRRRYNRYTYKQPKRSRRNRYR